MKQAAIYAVLMFFVMFGIVVTWYVERNAQVAQAMRAIDKEEAVIAVAQEEQSQGSSEVLGVDNENNEKPIVLKGTEGLSVLALLQKDNQVITEFRENGVKVISINGVGSEDEERRSGKQWRFSLNGKEATASADRIILSGNEDIVWSFQ